MKINSNIQALIANNALKVNEGKNAASTEKLSSGYKLNHASDSPAGMAISNKMRAQINSLNKAKDNTSNAVNVTQTADGALTEVHSMLQRMNQLAIKAANGTMSESDREDVQMEIKALKKEIDRVAADTEYNTQNLLGGEQEMKGYTDNKNVKVLGYDVDFPKGSYTLDLTKINQVDPLEPEVKLLDNGSEIANIKSYKITRDVDESGNLTGDGRVRAILKDGTDITFSYHSDPNSPTGDDPTLASNTPVVDVTGIGGMKVQVGSKSGQEIQLVVPKMDTVSLGIDKLDVRTAEKATEAIDKIAEAIEYVSKGRAQIGAYQNRFESTIASLEEAVENLTQSYSTIKDIDMATEMVNYTTLQVLVQAGTSMLTQANEQPQQALQLLQ